MTDLEILKTQIYEHLNYLYGFATAHATTVDQFCLCKESYDHILDNIIAIVRTKK